VRTGSRTPAAAGRRHAGRVEEQAAQTWGDRLSRDAQSALVEVVLAAQVMLWVLGAWVVSMVVVVVVWQLGPAFVVVVLAGWTALGLCTRRRLRAWRRLNAQVRADVGLTPRSLPYSAVTLRSGPAGYDESVARARRYEAVDVGAPADIPGTGWTARWERRLAGLFGDRYDAAAVREQRVRAEWLAVQVLAVLVAFSCLAFVLVDPALAGDVLLVAVALFAVGGVLGRRARRRTQRAAARHLGIPERLSARLPTKPDLIAFDEAVAGLRREAAAGGAR
jgi:cation transport ATPase